MKKNLSQDRLSGNRSVLRNLILKMKLIGILICIAGLTGSYASVYGQQTKLNMNVQDMTVKNILKQIEDQSEYSFMYNASQIDVYRKVDLNVKNSSVEDLLKMIFAGENVTYKIMDRHVIISTKSELKGSGQSQQSKTITGKVTDSNGEPLPGVTVMMKGTVNGTITGADGAYTIGNVPSNSVLIFSFVGMRTQEIEVAGKSSIQVALAEETIGLEEVVAVGYGVQKKVNLTGAVSVVKVDESLSSRSLTNVSSGLSGLIPGLTVTQTTGMAGKDGSSLRIRGLGSTNNSSPLIVVDGMPDININDLNMADIESISVLKDAASASVYGSRAANGVILITTKRGKEGNLSVNYNGSYAWTSLVNFYKYMPDYPRMMDFHNISYLNAGQSSRYTYGTMEQWMAMENLDPVRFPATNWWDVLFHSGTTQNHTISASAGTEKLNYYISVGIMDNSGVSINSSYNRKNFRLNVDYKMRDYLKIGTSIDGMWSNLKYPKDGGINTTVGGSNGDVTKIVPGVTPISPDGRYGSAQMAYMENSTISGNQYAALMNMFNNEEQQRFSGNIFGELTPLKGLTARIDYGLNYLNGFEQSYTKPYLTWNFQTGLPVNVITTNGGISNRYETSYKTLLQGRVTYNTKLFNDQHNLSALAVYTEEYWHERWLSGSRQDRIHPDLYELNAALTDKPSADGNSSSEGLRSVIGRINYDLYDKYLIEANVRADASSKFLSGHQWGIFPSFSLGWRFSNEAFFQPLTKIFSNAKLRGSWGKLGNNAGVSRYEQRDTYALTHYTFGGTLSNGLSSNKMVNKDFSWESTAVTNLGLDLAIFNGEVTAEIDAYSRLTSGIIRPMEMSTLLSGYTAPRNNMGELQNRGIEINLGWHKTISDFQWSINLNYSYNKNKLLSWSQRLGFGENFIGYPWQFVYTYEAIGIAQSWEDILNAPYQGSDKMAPGDILYEDLNGDGQITDSDRKALPNSPRGYFNANYGLNLNFSWKGIDLSALFQASTGSKDFWQDNFNRVYVNTSRNAYSTLHIDHWSLDNRESALPRLVNGSNSNGGRNQLASTFWLYSRDYLRLKNIQLGYSLPKNRLEKLKIHSLRFYVSGENLFTLTNWPGIDPEKPGGIAASSQDLYPLTRSFSVGLNLGF